MGRQNLIRQNTFPYHICSRSNHGTWFSIPLPEVWELSLHALSKAYRKTDQAVKLHAFVLMSNHYHMLLTTPNSDIDSFMYFFNKELSLQLRNKTQLKNRMLGGRYKYSIVSSNNYLWRVFRYVYQNPLRAQMCHKVEEYLFSTLSCQINCRPFPLPIDRELFDVNENIHWLNEKLPDDQSAGIKKGLSHPQFDIHPL